jgi:SET domain-containing protein
MKNNTRGNGKPLLDPTRCNFDIEFRPSKIHRWGAFTNEQIPARRRIIEYTGERISWAEAEWRDRRKRLYIFWLSERWALDGAVGGSGAEFINHSCDPNMTARIVNGHIYLSANRPIEPGEELTYDYNIDGDKASVTCKCGAKNCRGNTVR